MRQVYLVPTFFSNNFSDDIITYIEKTIIPSKLEIKKLSFQTGLIMKTHYTIN